MERTTSEPFTIVPLTDLAQVHVERPADWWRDYLPAGVVTLLGAHGGTGKSFIAAMLGVSIATGQPLFGVPTQQGRVAIFSGEDGADVLRHRLQWICRELHVNPAELADRLHVLDATEHDPALFHEVSAPGGRKHGATTPTYQALREYVDKHAIDVLMVDNASDTFDASEIDRARVRGFMRALATIAKPGRAVLLLAHIDKQIARGESKHSEGYSGSTAWHNSARSRLFLSREKDGALALQHQKANLGRMREPLALQWPENGIPDAIAPVGGMVARIEERNHTKALLALVHEFNERGESISTATVGRGAAPAMFVKEARFPRSLKPADVFALLRNAERTGWLAREQFRKADRKPAERWQLTDAGRTEIGAANAANPAPIELAANGAGAAANAANAQGGTGGESAHMESPQGHGA